MRLLPPLPRAVAAIVAIVAVVALVAVVAVAAPVATATTPATSSAIAPAPLTVGRVTLQWCPASGSWCATLPRPLDPTGAVAGTVPIYFEFYPHSSGAPSAGTLVAAEGGPGYPTTDSRGSYLALFAPLRTTRDVLLMDYRGTGRSGAVDCRELQNAPALTEANIGACGASLGARAPLYSSTLASDDLAALLEALGIARIDLYGDSYGSYFAQVFALRHGERLRSLVLDGADALDGPDYPWFPHYAPAMRDKFNIACQRAPECARLGGDSLQHIAPALARLRAQPFAAQVRAAGGQLLDFSADAAQLAIVMFGGSPAYATVRELDAAARAFTAGDSLPLLRLMAETLGSVDSRDPSRSPQKFSAGLAAAVTCLDPPQVFDMTLPPQQRVAQRDALIAQRRQSAPATYAPFSIDEYRRMPLDYAFIDECVRWPAARAAPLVAGALHYPDVPVLVLSGELDDMTSVADGAVVAGHFRRSHHVIIANGFHVNALPHSRSECGALVVRRFIEQLPGGGQLCGRRAAGASRGTLRAPCRRAAGGAGRAGQRCHRGRAAGGQRRAADLRGCDRARRAERRRGGPRSARRHVRGGGDCGRWLSTDAARRALDAGRRRVRPHRLARPQWRGARQRAACRRRWRDTRARVGGRGGGRTRDGTRAAQRSRRRGLRPGTLRTGSHGARVAACRIHQQPRRPARHGQRSAEQEGAGPGVVPGGIADDRYPDHPA